MYSLQFIFVSVQINLRTPQLISTDNPPKPTTFECQENIYDIKILNRWLPWMELMTYYLVVTLLTTNPIDN